MIIVTKNQFIRATNINHIILDELVENVQVGYKAYAMKKFLITVVYTPENGNPNQHNSELRECTVALTSKKDAYLLFKDMTHQIREQTPDALYLNKLLENFLTDPEIKKIADSESGENFKDEMKATLYDPDTAKVRRVRKAKRKSKRVLRKSKKRRK
jgi:hypothetical protein